MGVFRLIQSTFLNNPLAIAVSLFGVIHFSSEISHWWESRQAAKQAERKIEAVTERSTNRQQSIDRINEQAREAMQDENDYSFINQRGD